MKRLKFGIPKGSLEKATINLFEKSGWRININGRSYFPDINDDEIECAICRAQEMSRYVESGTLDAGLTGKDWIEENESDVVTVDDLIYSKVSQKPARWVLAVPAGSKIERLEDLQGKKIATELVNFTKRFFEERNIDVRVEFSWGATEAKVVSGLADAIVEVTETGSTIRAHGLKIIYELMQTNTQLIANKTSYEDPWKKGKIGQIILLLKGALRAENMVALKMNLPQEKVENVIAILPSLNAPTVAGLYNSDWVSVETVVDVRVVRDLIPRLIDAGAEGIIEYSLNKVI
ncbi:MAG: ATP phosphoribosyltransferase [Proteobacteria bacterium]|jgi:ATP phosphoribosyltransferase|nr:ATP phosphoribosyltransferase [Desulfobacterales bacterium]MBL7172575.1 ATP phosphoribosyltransferase [Desulfobacteraceae bacterium]MBU0988804.1 ATP phosphoribosyltransferase [Pseudomonadota bacterium]MBU1903431.1 ATP phosphoribosyltransferase [Pseudomonadota bacterium]